MRQAPALGFKPRSTPPGKGRTILLPLHGTGPAAPGPAITAVTYERQAVFSFAADPGAAAGQWVNVGTSTSMPGINGIWRVLQKLPNNKVRVDLDTSSLSGYSGADATMSANGIGDHYGVMTPKKLNGNVPNLWDDPYRGVHFQSNNYLAALVSDVIGLLDLRGFRGRILFGVDATLSDADGPSASEFWFCLGRFDTSGGGIEAGTIGIFQFTDGKIRVNVRGSVANAANTPANPGTAASSNGALLGTGGNPTRYHIGIELIFGAAAVTINFYFNGAIDSSSQINRVGEDWPYPLSTANGLTLFAKLGSGGYSNYVGAGGSGARAQYLLIHRSEAIEAGGMTTSDVARLFADTAAAGGLPDPELLW